MGSPPGPVSVRVLWNGQTQPGLRRIAPDAALTADQSFETANAELVEYFPLDLELLPPDVAIRVRARTLPQLEKIGLVALQDFQGLVVQTAGDGTTHADGVAGELALYRVGVNGPH